VANKTSWKTWTAKLAALAVASYAIVPVVPAKAEEAVGYKEVGVLNEAGIGLDTDGKVWGWGDYPKIGYDQDYAYDKPVPIRTSDGEQLDGIVDIANGVNFALALEDDGENQTVWAWGQNYTGQLGNGTYASTTVPTAVELPEGQIRSIAAGYSFGMALVDDKVYAWGDNSHGQTGGDDGYVDVTPVLVMKEDGSPLENVVDIAAGYNFAYAIVQTDDGDGDPERTLYAWGNPRWTGVASDNTYRAAPSDALGTDVNRVFAGWAGWHSFATVGDSVYGWGQNDDHQISPVPAPEISAPTHIEGLDEYRPTTIVPGWSHTVFIDEFGAVYGMGTNGDNQLGFLNPALDVPTPAPLKDGANNALTGAVSVFAGEYNSGAVFGPGSPFGAGAALAWGDNVSGVLGVGSDEWTVATPAEVIAPLPYGRSIAFKLVDPANPEVNRCGDAYLETGIGGDLPQLVLPDGTCVFPDVALNDTATVTFTDYTARYHEQTFRIGAVTEDVHLGALQLYPSYVAAAVSLSDTQLEPNRIGGYLSWELNNWPGTHEMKTKVFFVKADGEEAGLIAENLETNAYTLDDVEIPPGAVGIQIESTNKLAPYQSYTMPKPYVFLDAPTHLPVIEVRDVDPRAYGYDDGYIGLAPEIALKAPSALRYASYDVRFFMAGEGYHIQPVGVFDAAAGETLLLREQLDDLSFTSPNNFFYVYLVDEDGSIVFEGLPPLTIEFDNIAAEEVSFTAMEMATPNVSFSNADGTPGEAGGVVTWSWTDEAPPESFDGYVLYFVNEDGFKVKPIAKTRSYYTHKYELPMNTIVPDNAAGIGVFPYRTDGDASYEPSSTPLYAPLNGASEEPVRPTFYDNDHDILQIGGNLYVPEPPNPEAVSMYEVLIANANGSAAGEPIATAPATAQTIQVPYDTPIPDGRARIVLRTMLKDGSIAESSAQIWDSPAYRPNDMDYLDEDGARGTLSGRLEWSKPIKESLFDAYLIDVNKAEGVSYPRLPNVPVDPSKQRYSEEAPSFSPSQIRNFRLSQMTSGGEQSHTWHLIPVADNTTDEPYTNAVQSASIPAPTNANFYPSETGADGWMEWAHPAERDELYGYQLYFLDGAGNRVGSYVFIKYWAPAPGEPANANQFFELPPHIEFPENAASIAVHSVNADYTESAENSVVPLSRLDVSFDDMDHDANAIGGAVHWYVSWEPSSATGYEVYYGDASGQPIGTEPIATVAKGAQHLYSWAIQEGATAPETAKTFVVRMVSASGTIGQGHAVIWDRPTEFPRWEHAVDLDSSAGTVRPLIRWVGAPDESDIDAYLIEAHHGNEHYPIEAARVDVQSEGTAYYQYELPVEFVSTATHVRVVPLTAAGDRPWTTDYMPLHDEVSGSAKPVVEIDDQLPKPAYAWLEKAEGSNFAQGRVIWGSPGDAASVSGYRLYFLDGNGAKLQPLAYFNHHAEADRFTMPLAKELTIPAEASTIAVYTVNGGAESGQFASVSLSLLRDPPTVRELRWVDIDTDPGRVRGAVMWQPPVDESKVQSYDLYFGDAQGVLYGEPFASAAPGGTHSAVIPAGTKLQPYQRTIVVVTVTDEGASYAVAPLTDSASRNELGQKLQSMLRPAAEAKVELNHIRKYIRFGRLTNIAGDEGIGQEDMQLLLDLIEPRYLSEIGTN